MTSRQIKRMKMTKPKAVKKWRRVRGPRTWVPEPGDEIIGKYGGRTLKHGSYGPYEVVLVFTEDQAYVVSGVVIIQAIDAAQLEKGDIVRIVFHGYKTLDHGERRMKMFDLYVPEV